MITCALMGGLGNQMFQIAAGISLAFDVDDEFGINHSICYTPNQGNVSEKYKSSFFKKIRSISEFEMPTRIYQEPFYEFNSLIKEKNQIIRGYFQSEKYFIKHKEKITNLFYPDENELAYVFSVLKQMQENKRLVSIHIRRGDYLKFPENHFALSVDYYLEAMNIFKGAKFFVISDDIKWAKENLKSENIVFSNFNNEIYDFYAMLCCDHNIISNSTFSWWGAYLNKNIEKEVVCPQKWYLSATTKDLLPENWRILDKI